MFIQLNEATRTDLVSRSKRAEREKDGKTRYEKRLKSKVSTSTAQYNKIDMNKLFKEGILTVGIDVKGETNSYVVTITFGGFLDRIRDMLKRNNGKLDLSVIVRSLVNAFNSDDVYIGCSCLHPSTKIKLLDGSIPTIEEIYKRFEMGEKLYVYSVDNKGDFKPGEVEKVWITKTTKEFIKITLDNEQNIITTPDHPYMLRNGNYKMAQDLVIGESLMPMYFKDDNGYEQVKFNSTNKYHSVYKQVAEYFYKNQIQESTERSKIQREQGINKMSYDVAIHHKNFIKTNNNPENLQVMTGYEHWIYHSKLLKEKWKDPLFRLEQSKRATEHIKELNKNPTENMKQQRKDWAAKGNIVKYQGDGKARQSECVKRIWIKRKNENTKEYWENYAKTQSENFKKAWKNGCYDTECFKEAAKQRGELLRTPEMQKKAIEGGKKYWENISQEEKERRANISRESIKKAQAKIRGSHHTKEHNKKIILGRIRNVINMILALGLPVTFENYEIQRNIYQKEHNQKVPKLEKYFNTIEEVYQYYEINHKIKKIEHIIMEETPVYDLKIKEWENFVVEAGVVLHNCPDMKFRLQYFNTKNKINSTPPQMIPSNITNPHDRLGPGCKHVMMVLSNTSWIMRVASVIKNYITYMERNRENQYAKIIYPAIYGKEYEKPVQVGMFDNKDELETEKQTLDTTNRYARTRTQFQKDNPYRIRPTNRQSQGQVSIEDEIEEKEE